MFVWLLDFSRYQQILNIKIIKKKWISLILYIKKRFVANYIITNNKIKAKDIANHFKINIDTANNWIKKLIEKEFLQRFDDNQIRNVDYVLTKKYYNELK